MRQRVQLEPLFSNKINLRLVNVRYVKISRRIALILDRQVEESNLMS